MERFLKREPYRHVEPIGPCSLFAKETIFSDDIERLLLSEIFARETISINA